MRAGRTVGSSWRAFRKIYGSYFFLQSDKRIPGGLPMTTNGSVPEVQAGTAISTWNFKNLGLPVVPCQTAFLVQNSLFSSIFVDFRHYSYHIEAAVIDTSKHRQVGVRVVPIYSPLNFFISIPRNGFEFEIIRLERGENKSGNFRPPKRYLLPYRPYHC